MFDKEAVAQPDNCYGLVFNPIDKTVKSVYRKAEDTIWYPVAMNEDQKEMTERQLSAVKEYAVAFGLDEEWGTEEEIETNIDDAVAEKIAEIEARDNPPVKEK